MKITKGATSKHEAKISKVQQKLGLKKTGKISKASSNIKAKDFKSEVKEIFKKDIQSIPKTKKQKAGLEESAHDVKPNKHSKEVPNKANKLPNGSSKKAVKPNEEKNEKVDLKEVKNFGSKDFLNKKLKNKPEFNKSKKPVIAQEKTARNSDEDSDSDEASKKNAKKELSKDAKPSIPDKTVIRALNALNKLNENFQKKKNQLFTEETPVIIQIDSIKISQCTLRKLRFKLPHSLVTDASDICLFVCDLKRGKKVDHEPTQQHYEDLLREKGVTNIKTIIPIRQIRVEYDQIEMKRRLLTQHDFFLADGRVSGLLAHKLGNTFFQKNQLPTPIRMDAKNLKQEINCALHKTVLRLHGEGTSFTIRIGNGKQTPEHMCENIQAVLLQVAEQFPGGWNNIRSVYVKTPLSMAIPIYITLRNKNEIKRPIVKPLHSNDDMVEDEISTLLDAKVKVFKSGKVIVVKNKDGAKESDESIPTKKRKIDSKQKDSKKSNKKGFEKKSVDTDDSDMQEDDNDSGDNSEDTDEVNSDDGDKSNDDGDNSNDEEASDDEDKSNDEEASDNDESD